MYSTDAVCYDLRHVLSALLRQRTCRCFGLSCSLGFALLGIGLSGLHMVTARSVVLVAKNPFASSGGVRGHGFDTWVRKIPWRRALHHSPVFSPGESHRQRSLGSTVHRVTKSWTRLKYLSSSREVSLLLCMIVVRMFIGFRQVTHPLWAFQCSLEVRVRQTCVRLCDHEVT